MLIKQSFFRGRGWDTRGSNPVVPTTISKTMPSIFKCSTFAIILRRQFELVIILKNVADSLLNVTNQYCQIIQFLLTFNCCDVRQDTEY